MSYQLESAKFEYEYMGKSPEEISSVYNLPMPLIAAEVDSKRWMIKLEASALPTTNNIKQFAQQLEDLTRSRLSVVSLFRQINNQPLYASLEKALLEKLLQIVHNMHELDDKAATKLLNVAKAIESIQAREPIALAEKVADAAKKGGSSVQVLIQNNLGEEAQIQ